MTARVLIVDDHVRLMEAIADDLRAQGYVVDLASQPDVLPDQGGWDVALVDILFENSEWTGLTTLQRLQTQSPGTALVLFTTPAGGRSIAITEAFRRFDIRGALSKSESGSIETCLADVLRGKRHIDVALMPYVPAESFEMKGSIRKLLEKPAHREVMFALLDGATRVRDIAEAVLRPISLTERKKAEAAISKRLADMAQRLRETGYLTDREQMSIGDWVGFVEEHRALLRAETLQLEFQGEQGT